VIVFTATINALYDVGPVRSETFRGLVFLKILS
jgi:hypothetical protein